MGLLRTLFALAILLAHSGQTAFYQPMNGDTAVQAFYVVSGFYIAMVYNTGYARYDNAPLVFWANRYLRLAPLYLLVSVAALALNGPAILHGLGSAATALLAASQVTLLGQDLWVFLDYDTASGGFSFLWKTAQQMSASLAEGHRLGSSMLPIPPGWSIGVEMWFYLLAPLLVTRRPRSLALICAATFVARFAFYGLSSLSKDPWTYRFFPFELGVFLLGVLAWHGYEALRRRPQLLRFSPWILGGLLALTVSYYYLPGGGQERRLAFVALLAAGIPFVFALTRDWPLDRLVGDLSYPIYIVHMLVVSRIPGPWGVVVAIGLAIGAAFLIERPIDRFRHAFTQRLARSSAATLPQEAA